ncbi:IS3 family transposase [Sulfitobacter porphyrae]|uniref:IS3 family transposase n=1 Tax=Sulfitobacter porphyrae TaxID=1246864 RepID=A0ABW2BCB5_9RHOB
MDLKLEIECVREQNYKVYGVRKVWHQLRRDGFDVARCTVAWLMKDLALEGISRGKKHRTTILDKSQPCPLDKMNRRFKAPAQFQCCGIRNLGVGGLVLRPRLLVPIGNVPPAEAEANCHAAPERSDMGRVTKINQLPATSVQFRYCRRRSRSYEESVSASCNECGRIRCDPPETAMRGVASVLFVVTAKSCRDGSLSICASLGARTAGIGSRSSIDATGLRQTICEAREDRRG